MPGSLVGHQACQTVDGTVDPMETAPTEQLKEHGGDYYLTTMRRNLDNIAAKMK